jgi:hypothetical protein
VSLIASINKRLRLLQYRDRRVDEIAGYDWARIHHNRIEMINRAVCRFGAETCRYLEIGCASDVCFNAIMAGRKVGVDPARGGTVRSTSDDFFKSNRQVFDLIFVDGLHTYDQARRDAENGLACLRVGGVMFFHDMLANSWVEEAPVMISGAWTGDVWKLGIDLAATSGLAYRTVIADHGVGVLRKDDPSPVLPSRTRQDQRNFADFLKSRDEINLIDFDQYVAFLLDSA